MQFKAGQNNNHVKLKSGESVVGLLRGEIYEFKQHWIQSTKSSAICIGPPDCTECALGNKPSFRFKVNMLIHDGKVFVPHILEQGWNVYKQLQTLHEELNLEKNFIKIVRNGAGTQTTYSIIPIANGALKPEHEEKVDQVKLLPLGPPSPLPAPSAIAAMEDANESDIPF